MKVTPKRTFLLRQVDGPNGKTDVIAKKGEKIEVTDDEHNRLRFSIVETAPYKKKLGFK
jgi:hypothetical protein